MGQREKYCNNESITLSVIYYITLLLTVQIGVSYAVNGEVSHNTPPTMWLERNWRILETKPVGSKIVQVHGSDAEGDSLTYGLEPLQLLQSDETPKELPFRINPQTGIVYLNESLQGRAGQDIYLYVTASDGDLVVKSEVLVNILNEPIYTVIFNIN